MKVAGNLSLGSASWIEPNYANRTGSNLPSPVLCSSMKCVTGQVRCQASGLGRSFSIAQLLPCPLSDGRQARAGHAFFPCPQGYS